MALLPLLLLPLLALLLGLLAFSSGDRVKGGDAPGGNGRGALRSCLRCSKCTVFSLRPARRPAAVARLKFSALPRLVSPPKAHTGGVRTTYSLAVVGALSLTYSLVPRAPLLEVPLLAGGGGGGGASAAASAPVRLRLPLMLAKAAETTETGELSKTLLLPPPLKKDNRRFRLLLLLLLLRLLLLLLLLISPAEDAGKSASFASEAAAAAAEAAAARS